MEDIKRDLGLLMSLSNYALGAVERGDQEQADAWIQSLRRTFQRFEAHLETANEAPKSIDEPPEVKH